MATRQDLARSGQRAAPAAAVDVPTGLAASDDAMALALALPTSFSLLLDNARHLVAPHATHIVASQSCAPKLISQFINQQSAANLDASCLNQELRKPFFTNANGVALLTADQE